MARTSRLFHTKSLCNASISIRNLLLGIQILFFQIPAVYNTFKIVLAKIKQDLLLDLASQSYRLRPLSNTFCTRGFPHRSERGCARF